MNFVIYGNDISYIKQKTKEELILRFNRDYEEYYYYFSDGLYTEIVEQLSTTSILSTYKVIIMRIEWTDFNICFLKNKTALDNNLMGFIDHLSQGDWAESNVFIIQCEMPLNIVNSIDFPNIFSNFTLLSAEITKSFIDDHIDKAISQNKLNITADALNYLYNNSLLNIINTDHNINKLININGPIDLKLIKSIIPSITKANIFELINYFIMGDNKHFWYEYYLYLSKNGDIFNLIGLLAAQLTLLRNIKILKKVENLSLKEISEKLKMNSYRINALNRLIDQIEIIEINNLLTDLYLLERQAKLGIIPKELGINLYFLQSRV